MKGRCNVCMDKLPERGILGINTSDIVSGFGMVTFRADQFDDAAHFDAVVCGPRCAAALYQMRLEKTTGVDAAPLPGVCDEEKKEAA